MSFCSVVFRSFVVVVLFLIHNTLCDRWDVVDQVISEIKQSINQLLVFYFFNKTTDSKVKFNEPYFFGF
jgi:3-methyladenine DNA glycosylase AlkD